MYRPQIKVLDCTIRDGGLINNHYFTDEFVREAYRALSRSGIMVDAHRVREQAFAPAGASRQAGCARILTPEPSGTRLPARTRFFLALPGGESTVWSS